MNFLIRQCLEKLRRPANKNNVHNFLRTCSYKSAHSLENMYPTSNLNLYTPNFVPEDSLSKFNGYIPLNEIDITYSSSTGPGGQNVNRVNTKVDVRFNIQKASWISDTIKDELLKKHKNKINKNGYLIVKSDLTRSQQLNLADALRKLRQLIRDLIVVPEEPSEYTLEKSRQRKIKASQERVFAKRKRSDIKISRQAFDTTY